MFQEVNSSTDNFSYEKESFSKTQMEMNPNMNQNINYSQNMGSCCQSSNMTCQNICEPPRERVCHRYFCYEVPHIVPCNTRIINHHIYKHSYIPQYTCCEENECSNVYDNCQNNFF